MSLDLGNIVASAAASNMPTPAKGPSPVLVVKVAEALAAFDAAAEASLKAEVLKDELFAAMKAESIDKIEVKGRVGPVEIKRGESCSAPGQGVLKKFLPPDMVEKIWESTKKAWERLSLPKPEQPSL